MNSFQFRSALRVLLLLPALATPAAADDLQQEWTNIQESTDRQLQHDWWQRLDVDQLQACLQAGVDVNLANKRRWTPLHSAARYSPDAGMVRMLIRAGADVDAKNRSGDTPLHWAAAENPAVDVVNVLIDAGANVNARDRFGWLPIHTAAEGNPNPEIIDALLDAGSERNKRAYFLLFRPVFLLKHNASMTEADKKTALARLREDN